MSHPSVITGADRSGTSLMFAIIASHPDVAMVRRSNVWRWLDGAFGPLDQIENLDRCLDQIARYERLQVLQPDVARIRQDFLEGEQTYGRLFEIAFRHHAERLGKSRWGVAEQWEAGGNSSFGVFESGTIFTRSIGRDCQTPDRPTIELIDAVCGRRMVRFGYERVTASRDLSARRRLLDGPAWRLKAVAWSRLEARKESGKGVPKRRLLAVRSGGADGPQNEPIDSPASGTSAHRDR